MGVCAADLLEDGVEARGPTLVDSTGEDGTSDGGAGGSEFDNAVDTDGDFVWLSDFTRGCSCRVRWINPDNNTTTVYITLQKIFIEHQVSSQAFNLVVRRGVLYIVVGSIFGLKEYN